jgi:hypothetical protein
VGKIRLRKIAIVSAFAVGAALTLSSCVSTSADGIEQHAYAKNAVSGERTYVGEAAFVNRDCSPVGVPSARVIEAPEHGRLEIVDQAVTHYFSGEFAKCRLVKVPGVAGYYTSTNGYRGKDKMTIRVSYRNGHVEDTILNVNIVR